MGSRWRIRRLRTGPQSEPRGHISFTRSGSRRSAGVRRRPQPSASCPGVAQPSGGFARGRASTPLRTGAARAIAPPPGSLGATTDTDRPHGRRVRQTSLPRHSTCRSTQRPSGSSSTTPSGPARPLRLARVPRPGMTNTDVRLGTHPEDRTRQGIPAVGLSPRLRLDRSADRFPLAPLRNGVVWSCGVDERGAAGTLPGAAQGRRIADPVPSASGPEIAATAVERRRADAPGVAGTVPAVAGRVAGIARRVRDRGVARAGLRAGSVGTGGCRAAQGLRA